MATRLPAHVALLRAINVGGTGKLAMADLRRLFEDAGCEDVRTYIQSGNVVFRAPNKLVRGLPKRIADAVESERGFRPPVVMRTEEELRAAFANNAFPEVKELKLLNVAFLENVPAKGLHLDPERSPTDRFALRGRELYLHYPNGSARTKLDGKYIERCLKTTMTMRNWRTVGKLVEMLD